MAEVQGKDDEKLHANVGKDNKEDMDQESRLGPAEKAAQEKKEEEDRRPKEDENIQPTKGPTDPEEDFEQARDAAANRNETPASNMVHSNEQSVAAFEAQQRENAELVHKSETTPPSTYGETPQDDGETVK